MPLFHPIRPRLLIQEQSEMDPICLIIINVIVARSIMLMTIMVFFAHFQPSFQIDSLVSDFFEVFVIKEAFRFAAVAFAGFVMLGAVSFFCIYVDQRYNTIKDHPHIQLYTY